MPSQVTSQRLMHRYSKVVKLNDPAAQARLEKACEQSIVAGCMQAYLHELEKRRELFDALMPAIAERVLPEHLDKLIEMTIDRKLGTIKLPSAASDDDLEIILQAEAEAVKFRKVRDGRRMGAEHAKAENEKRSQEAKKRYAAICLRYDALRAQGKTNKEAKSQIVREIRRRGEKISERTVRRALDYRRLPGKPNA